MAIAAATLQGASTITVGTTATPLSATPIPCAQCIVQVDPTNGSDCLIGGVDGQTLHFVANDIVVMNVSDVSLIYAKALAGTCQINFQPKVA